MSHVTKVFNLIKEKDIKFINFRFTDMLGQWKNITYIADTLDEKTFSHGIMVDGSSIKGWKPIEQSDLILMPDASAMFIDPFIAEPTLVLLCDIIDPQTSASYFNDPRQIAKRAEQYLIDSKIANIAYFGPELEFFIFDDIRFKTSINETFVYINSEEGPYNNGQKITPNNLGHRSELKNHYLAIPPTDTMQEIRSEMLQILNDTGVKAIMHHTEVAPSQCELGIGFDRLLNTADNIQKYKYIVRNVARSYGKTATFMPKPFKEDNGSGMHLHHSLWHDNQPIFPGNQYSNLSQNCLYYIGGIIKYTKAINAFTNPTTNSYKRLVPGFEAPLYLVYSSCNRSAAIRIPFVHDFCQNRIEIRFPDPTANPYYALSAILLAGIAGIKNKIDPGEAIDENLYETAKNNKNIKTVSFSLRESLYELSENREFLTANNVFSDKFIDTYIALKKEECNKVEQAPHPLEFSLYYSS